MSSSLTPLITISGCTFVREGRRFIIRGVVYQPLRRAGRVFKVEDLDPLRDERLDDLRKDILLLNELGVNTIKVYTLLPALSHDAAFEALAAAGIYVIVGLSTPRKCINRLKPYESYTAELLSHYFRTVDCVSQYGNVLGVVAGDHVINNSETTQAAEVLRAVIRDVKIHMKRQHQLKGQRLLVVGIADEVFPASSTDSIDYFTAGDKDEQIDFYSFVNYDQVTDPPSHWAALVQRFAGRGLPIFVSEYGSNMIRPRPFYETASLHSPNVTRVLSGGFAYEFAEGPNRYGLVTADHQKLEDFDNLKARLHQVVQEGNDVAIDLEQSATMHHADFPLVSASWQASSEIPTLQLFPQ